MCIGKGWLVKYVTSNCMHCSTESANNTAKSREAFLNSSLSIFFCFNTRKTANTFIQYWYRCNKRQVWADTLRVSLAVEFLAVWSERNWVSYLKLLCDVQFPLCGLYWLKAQDLFSELDTVILAVVQMCHQYNCTHTWTHSDVCTLKCTHTYAHKINTAVLLSNGLDSNITLSTLALSSCWLCLYSSIYLSWCALCMCVHELRCVWAFFLLLVVFGRGTARRSDKWGKHGSWEKKCWV